MDEQYGDNLDLIIIRERERETCTTYNCFIKISKTYKFFVPITGKITHILFIYILLIIIIINNNHNINNIYNFIC